MNNLDNVNVSPCAVERWRLAIYRAVARWQREGFVWDEPLPEEDCELATEGRLRIFVVVPGVLAGRRTSRTFEMFLLPTEWELVLHTN